MKTALKTLAVALVAMFFSSCSHQAIYYDDASGNIVDSSSSLSSEGKNDVLPVVVEVSPVEVAAAPVVFEAPKKVKKTKTVKKAKKVKKVRVAKAKKRGCTKCFSLYCPRSGRCGSISKKVLNRATVQGGTGEPHLGLIPTMKTLAPDL